ncbi:protein CYCLOPS isoform X2 [Medicago truncatula]|uniref:protein CYCLOPS isoform X2 n=1 Tax=Medicago truncatula TaxID=3880 RepID=UPI000D2F15A2|nr:protein CYCLOPS-like isoform X2 [Medicago truncatula]
MEGRGFYSLYKNSSEELFLKTLMDNPIGVPIPTMDMPSFKAVSQSFRTDSEELFKKWLTNEEGYNSSSKGLHSKLSQRMSYELSNLSNMQNMSVISEGRIMQDDPKANDYSTDFNQFPLGEPVDEVQQSSNLFLAKAWFLSDQRMTRSRSSELRQRYCQMHNAQVAQGIESVHMLATQNGNNTQQEVSNLNGFNHLNQKGAFTSPSNSSSSTFNTHQLNDNTDKISSYVNMLKDTLEHKRLTSQIAKQGVEDNSNELFNPQEDYFLQTSFDEGNENWNHQNPIYVEGSSTIQVKDHEVMQTLEASINLIDLDGLANQTNPIYLSSASPSESSIAATLVSTGFDGCDGPCISSQTLCESSWNKVGGSASLENRVRGFREQKIDNLKDDREKRSLERYASVTSEDKENATKRRRVERARKMAEAKERNLIPSIPPDMQAVLKRCEDLEKEVRSLKLNLSFMNRKDSEQTKQIEDLHKQNEDLTDEKEHLLEEIETLVSKNGKL